MCLYAKEAVEGTWKQFGNEFLFLSLLKPTRQQRQSPQCSSLYTAHIATSVEYI